LLLELPSNLKSSYRTQFACRETKIVYIPNAVKEAGLLKQTDVCEMEESNVACA
jgi:hypothetical protein